MIGETVGNYQVISQLGEGGMGLVYLAEHPLIGSKVAIKVLHRELANNQDVVSRFFTEARSVNDIRHPNIVKIADFGEKDGQCYIVMEYLEGESLAERLARVGPLDDRTAARMMVLVASALGAAHARGIVHRDLKPDNVFLTMRPGEPEGLRVLDFGIAKLLGNPFETSHKTQTGSIIGTPYYMSPEQCLAKKDLDGRSDIYALGTVMYEMVTGAPPFAEGSLGELIVAHTSQPPVPPRQHNPNVSEAMQVIILRALAKDRDARYQTMEEMRQVLGHLAGGVGPLAVTSTDAALSVGNTPPLGVPTTTGATPTTLSAAAGSIRGDDKPATHSRIPIIAGGLAVVGALVALVVLSGGESSDAVTAPAAAPVAAVAAVAADAAPAPDPLAAADDAAPLPLPSKIVLVTSEPSADVYRGDEKLGRTPVNVDVPGDGTAVALELRRTGYETGHLEVSSRGEDKVASQLERVARKRGSSKTTGAKQRGPRPIDETKKKPDKPAFTVKPIE